MPHLDKRLRAVFELIGEVNLLADIGADHGKLLVEAIIRGKAQNGIAVDISAESLHKAKECAEYYGASDRIEFCVGDGFIPIDKEVDCAVIAGMGGNEIVSILSQKHSAKRYVLVPHQDAVLLRKFLRDNDFFIKKDFVVKENKYYEIIEAVKGQNNYTDTEIFVGKNFPAKVDYDMRLEYREKILSDIVVKHTALGKNSVLAPEISEELEVIKLCRNSRK